MSLTISGSNLNSISSLFSSLSTSSSSSYSSSGLESLLSDYATIKSGTYGKLLKSYYSKVEASDDDSSSTSTDKAKTSSLNSVKADATELASATETLLDKSSDSIWKKVSKTDEDGKTTTDYDKDKIYDAVSKYIDAYNDLVDSGQKSSNTGILTQVASMVTGSAKSLSTLSQVGISITSDNHLKIDESYFKNTADMNTVKSLFNGNGSYAYSVATKASMVKSYASSSLADITGNKSYTSSGNYSLSTSDIINSWSASV